MNDDELRRLLEDAVSDIEPRDSLSSIHARTKVRSMSSKRSWLLGAGAAVVATAATVMAVAVLADGGWTDDPGVADPAAVTNGVTSQGASPTSTEQPGPSESAPAGTTAVPVYYVGDTPHGPRLYREFHRVSTSEPARTAVEEAVSDPTDPDYRSPWPSGTQVGEVGYDGDVVTVGLQPPDPGGEGTDLRRRPDGMAQDEAEVAVQQLVYTVQAALQQGRPPVQFLIDGERTDLLLGVPVAEPLAQDAAEDVLAQVWIIGPAEGDKVTAPFEVEGLAAAFEATVAWELRDGDRVVQDGFTTARECCTMAPYSFEVSAPPGEYTLVVQNTDPSAGEGPGVSEDTKQVTVLP